MILQTRVIRLDDYKKPLRLLCIRNKEKQMGYEAKKTEHTVLKNGRGAYWGRKVDAKKQSNRKWREQDKTLIRKTENDRN